MVGSYTAGSVNAEVTLDATKFNDAIDKLKGKVTDLKQELDGAGGFNTLTKKVKELEAELGKSNDKISNLRDTIDNLRKTNEKLSKELNSSSKGLKEEQTLLERVTEKTNEAAKATDNLNKKLNNSTASGRHLTETGEALRKQREELEAAGKTWRAYVGEVPNTGEKASVALSKMNAAAEKNKQVIFDGKVVYEQWRAEIRKAIADLDKLKFKASDDKRGQAYSGYAQWKNVINEALPDEQWMKTVEGIERVITRVRQMGEVTKNFFSNTVADGSKVFVPITEGAEKFKQRLVEIAAQTKATFETMQVELAKANAAQYKYWKQVRGSRNSGDPLTQYKGYNDYLKNISNIDVNPDWTGRPLQIQGYNDYLKSIKEINAEVAKFSNGVPSIYESTSMTGKAFTNAANGVRLLYEELNKFTAQQEKSTITNRELGAQLQRLKSQISAFSNTGVGKKALAEDARQIQTLSNKLTNLSTKFSQGKINADQYAAGLSKIQKDLSTTHTRIQTTTRDLQQNNLALTESGKVLNKNSAEWKKLEANARQTGRGLTSFNNGMVQTAHSGRILSNTLYQIRGALLSLKMIATAFGGMALWGFAMDMAEAVKQTFTAKNEMEAQLKQNEKVSDGGIAYFNQQLEKTTELFPKINKYAIGETVSSIGLEFNMTAKQMAESLDVVSMIQSEYVRAGRTSEEAALAVKDILQGEFQRLSRETGVGKEELVAYGWDEDKTNIEGLMDALRKAALDRHWDIFAQKATSLNDVMTITKSRFSETSADIAQSATPLIVGAFNTLIDIIDKVHNAFNSLSSFWQTFTLTGGGAIGLGGILTALPMVIKGMGLADIVTLGWKKSIITTVFNLNKYEVGLYGVRKALAAVITGTSAAELTETRWTKAILGRIMGVKQSTLADKGWLSALVESRMVLKGHTLQISNAELASLRWSQKLAYLTGNMDMTTAKSLKHGEAIRKVVTSWRLWRTVILGVIGIGLVAWFASVAAWCDTIKKKIDVFNNMLESGQDRYNSAKKTVQEYTDKINKLTKGTEEYNQAVKNRKVAISNRNDIYKAKELSKQYDEQNKKLKESNDLRLQGIRNRLYNENGLNTEKEGYWSKQVEQAQEYLLKSEKEREKFEYASLQHINEHVTAMKEAGVSEKDRLKYITEYSTKAEEAAQHLKEFNQGDVMAGVYYVLDRFGLVWIDLWNDQHFINFWESVQNTWKSIQPTVDWLIKRLGDLGHMLLDFFATDEGQVLGGILAFTAAGAAIGVKVVPKIKSVVDVLSGVKDKLKDVAGGWKNVADKAEDAAEKMGGKTSTDKTTGGITGDIDVSKTTGGIKKGKFWETVGQDAKNTGRNMFKYMGYIAAATVLVTEAIVLLNAPMLALAGTGEVFKQVEPQVRKGIEGLSLIAPVVLALLAPMIALMYVLGKFNIDSATLTKGFKDAAVGVALAITLVTEAIVLLNAPLLGLAILGSVYGGVKDSAEQGIKAMDLVNQALMALVPWVPVFAAGIALAAVTLGSGGIGGIAIVAAAAGIAIGIGLVTEAIIGLVIPLEALGEIGDNFPDLSRVQQGAEAIKITSEALGYVEDAMGHLAGVKWDLLSDYVAQLIGITIGVDLTQLAGEGGLFSQLEDFTKQFNQITIEKIDTAKVTALSDSATGIDSVKTALQTVQDALKDLPDFEVDNRSTNEKYQDAVSGAETTEGISNYFEQLKQPIEQLNEFINHFNNEITVVDVNPDKIETISRSAEAIGTINSAIENVKTALGNSVDAAWNANMASGGILGAAVGFIMGDGNPNASGLKSGLDELYLACKDIMDFNTKIAGLTSTGSGNTEGVTNASNMVSALQTEINNLKTTLSGAIPTVKSAAKDMGASIVTGVKDGVSTLSSDISPSFDTMVTTVTDYGTKATDGFKEKFKLKDTVSTEVENALSALDGKEDEFYNKGKLLGDAFQRGYKDGGGISSPGYAAQAAQQEIGYIEQYIQDGINNVPQKAFELANLISSNMTFDLGLSNLQLPDMTDFQMKLNTIIPMVSNVKTQVSNGFNTMKTNIGNSLSGLAVDATSKYGHIVSTTRSSLTNMQSQTTKNIGAIRSSWAGMQSALIASAENIRTETSTKINNLKDNMASFWQKIRNPELLISGAAGPANSGKGTIRRRSAPRSSGFAGPGAPSRSQSLFQTSRKSKGSPSDLLAEYLKCIIETGKPCYAGWDFNWSPDISNRFKKWDTHFAKYHLDDFLKVGSFENNNFPVKGRADVAKQYIFDVIAGTDYDGYFDSNFGEDPVAALRAGRFNCWDGTNIVLAIARAFGFYGSRGHGTWNGVGHVWASIPGLGIIDPTAIQQRRSFTSSAVSGYAGPARGTARRGSGNSNDGNTYNTNIEINVHGDDVSVNDQKIDNSTGRKIIDLLGISPSTGR